MGIAIFDKMQLETAIRLIQKGIPQSNTRQVWADLGAGSGLFTHALSCLLPTGSIVYAVDQDAKAIESVTVHSGITLRTTKANFINDEFVTEPLDGVLMANALHFVRDKVSFLTALTKKLKPTGQLVIVEYERDQSNPWVPFPITLEQLQKLGKDTGLMSVEKLEETPSVFGNGMMYAALLK